MTVDKDILPISILQTSGGLICLQIKRNEEFEPPTPRSDDDDDSEQDGTVQASYSPYEIEAVPLNKAGLEPFQAKLLEHAWTRLGTVERMAPETVIDVLALSAFTVADPKDSPRQLPPLVPPEASEKPRRTAAHPRGYQGTKYKPPKPRQDEAIDLRPYLRNRQYFGKLLAALTPHWPEAKQQIEAMSESYTKEIATCGQTLFNASPARQGITGLPEMPEVFQQELYWLVRGTESQQLTRLLAIWNTLNLQQEIPLRRCLVRMIADTPMDRVFEWADILAGLTPLRRVHMAELLIETGLTRQHPTPPLLDAFGVVHSLKSDAIWKHRLYYLMQTHLNDHDLEYALDGFRLADECECRPAWSFSETGSARGIYDLLSSVTSAWKTSVCDNRDFFTMIFWKRCSSLEGFAECLAGIPWAEFPEDWRDFAEILYHIDTTELLKRYRPYIDEFVSFFRTTPEEFIPKAAVHIHDWVNQSSDNDALLVRWPAMKEIIARLCRPPFDEDNDVHKVVTGLVRLPEPQWAKVFQADDQVWLAVDQFCKRQNDANLCADGIVLMVAYHPEIVGQAFGRHTGKLLRTARVLGTLSSDQQRAILERFKEHPVISLTESADDVHAWYAFYEQFRNQLATDPLPARLKRYCRGECSLTESQLQRDRERLHEAWPGTCLDLLTHSAMADLATGIEADFQRPDVRHALLMQPGASENRRALRSFLKAWFDGDLDYIESHPLNREWLARHPAIRPDVWLSEHRHRYVHPTLGELELSIEQDPLEMLRCGTYVGSCFGIGGICAESPVAFTLDINKQVVYARDGKGCVIARQLIGITEQDQLVCYRVYPYDNSRELFRIFRKYDQNLAEALGIELQGNDEHDEDEDVVEEIISQYFFDDGVMDNERYGQNDD